MRDSLLWLVTLARKAGKAYTGAFLSERAVKSGRARLVIIAADASDNTKKKFYDCCAYCGTACFEYASKELLARYTGKENVSVIAVTDENFARGIEGKFKEMKN